MSLTLEGSLEVFSDIYKGNFHRKHYRISRRSVRRYCQANSLQRDSSKKLNNFCSWAIVVKQNCSGICDKKCGRPFVTVQYSPQLL